MQKRKIPFKTEMFVAGEQHYRCANEPGANLRGLEGYNCPMWKEDGIDKGLFDESGYRMNHIIERSIGGSDDVDNLQALCVPCHTVKTKRFMRNFNNKTKDKNNNNNNDDSD